MKRKFDSKDAQQVRMVHFHEMLDLSLELCKFLFSWMHIHWSIIIYRGRVYVVTLGTSVVFGVELNRVDFKRKCGMDVITQRIGEVCHTQALYNAV